MARRLATSGYYVMLPNLYYRSGVMEIGPIPPDPEAPERKRMFGFMNSINIPLVMEDTKALLAYAETQAAANTKIVGTVGYCMSGRYAINAATHFPDRVKAAASIYGTHLATDQPDSPHLAAQQDQGRTLFRLRRDRHLRAAGDDRQGRSRHEGHRTPRSRSIPAPITASPSRSGRSTTATPPSGTGSGCWRSIAATSCHRHRSRDALPHHRLSGIRSRSPSRSDRSRSAGMRWPISAASCSAGSMRAR